MSEFQKFYTATRERLFSYLMRRCGDYQLSDDITQESFTRILEKYDSREKNASLLFTISRNLLNDHFRRDRKLVEYNDSYHSVPEEKQERYEPRQEVQRILDAVKQLTQEEQDLLALVMDGDLKYQEIANKTGMSIANVKVKIHRARKKLQILLQE